MDNRGGISEHHAINLSQESLPYFPSVLPIIPVVIPLAVDLIDTNTPLLIRTGSLERDRKL